VAPTNTLQVEARALGDPTRHAVFRYLVDAGRPVGVAELTGHFGFNHNAIRQHLAKLVAAGLVLESQAAARGPGRPPLVYEAAPASSGRWAGAGPFERLSRLLLEIIRTGDTPVEVGRRAADQFRVASPSGTALGDLPGAMARQGFEPEVRVGRTVSDVVLHECPFASVARADREVVCGLHLGIAEGLADGTDGVIEELVAYDPRQAQCRLRIRPRVAGAADPAPPGRLVLRGRAPRS
jgi:predicted ArsR family transcriptional regulator